MKRKYNILVIEENTAEVQLISECLNILKYEAELSVARTANEALSYLHYTRKVQQVSTPDLILSDITFPGGSAFDILRDIKKDKGLTKIPFVVLTSSEYIEDIELCYQLGAAAIIKKEADIKLLVKKIKEIMEMLESD